MFTTKRSKEERDWGREGAKEGGRKSKERKQVLDLYRTHSNQICFKTKRITQVMFGTTCSHLPPYSLEVRSASGLQHLMQDKKEAMCGFR